MNIFILIFINIIALFISPISITSDSDALISFVNPIVIHNNIRVNWFGAWLLAIIFNVSLPIISIPYWIYKFFTIGD